MIHTFAGNTLDRADALRRNESQIQAAAEKADSRYLAFSNLNVLVHSNNTDDSPNNKSLELGWLQQKDIARLNLDIPPVLLGIDNSDGTGVTHFAIDISALGDPIHELGLDGDWQFKDCRVAAMELPDNQTGVIAQSRSQLEWHSHHQYCSRCGVRTQQRKGGHVRHCPGCQADHFPRTDPVVIMLITDGDRCLLGQSAGQLAYSGMYSTLAGFIDQGESIEEAVRREIKEEAGITVGDVSYHSSQPWPFPSSLMIGCQGKAITTDITIDEVEMADVRWFSRDEVTRSLQRKNKDLRLPGPIAIAHHLIKSWVGETP